MNIQIPKEDRTKVAFWQVELEESDGDKVKYPEGKARLNDGNIDWTKLLTYQSLKLSDNAVISELAQTNAPLIVGEPLEPVSTATETCVCKEYDLIWGNKVSCEFRKKVVEIAKELWGESKKVEMANVLMAVIRAKKQLSLHVMPMQIQRLQQVGKIR